MLKKSLLLFLIFFSRESFGVKKRIRETKNREAMTQLKIAKAKENCICIHCFANAARSGGWEWKEDYSLAGVRCTCATVLKFTALAGALMFVYYLGWPSGPDRLTPLNFGMRFG